MVLLVRVGLRASSSRIALLPCSRYSMASSANNSGTDMPTLQSSSLGAHRRDRETPHRFAHGCRRGSLPCSKDCRSSLHLRSLDCKPSATTFLREVRWSGKQRRMAEIEWMITRWSAHLMVHASAGIGGRCGEGTTIDVPDDKNRPLASPQFKPNVATPRSPKRKG